MSDNSNDRSRARHAGRKGHAHPDPGGRARGPDRRLPAGQAGAPGDRLRGRGPGRRHRQDRGPRRPGRQVPLRPRRPSLLHQGQGGRRPLARDHEGGVPRAPAHVAHLLAQPQGRGQVPRLPAARPGRAQEARPGRPDQGALLLPRRRRPAQGQGGDLRAVGLQPLRQVALQPVLQVLHREGVGRPDLRDPLRVGRPADQEPVVLPGRLVGVLRQQGQQGHEPDRQVQLPALRPRPDVGDDDHRHRGARRQGAAEHAGREARGRGRPRAEGDRRAARSTSPTT